MYRGMASRRLCLGRARHRTAPRSPHGIQDDDGAGVPLPRDRHRRVGSGARQHPVAGRPDPRAPLRAVQPPVDRPRPTSRPARRHHRRRMGRGRPGRPYRGDPVAGQAARDQGGSHRPQRDGDGRDERRRGRPQGDRRGTASRPAVRGRGQLHRLDRLSDGRVERGPGDHRVAKGTDAARRTRASVRQPQGARRPRARQVPARVLRLRGHDQGERHRIFPVHTLHPEAVRAARVARHYLRGRAGQHFRTPSATRGGRARRGPGVGGRPQALRQGAEVVLQHRDRDHGAGGHERGRRDRRGVPSLQPGARGRPRPDGGEAVPDRPPRGPERAHAARRPRGRGDGDARRRPPGDARCRRGRGRRALPQHRRPGRAARRAGPVAFLTPLAFLAGSREGMSLTRYEPAHPRLQRSELAVPGSQPVLFQKALDGAADYVFLDLEDAVAPADKEPARTHVVAGLLDFDWKARGKTVSVRVNGIDTHYMYRDVVDVVEQAGHKLDTVLVPKVGVPADVYLVDALLTQIEPARRIPHRIGIEVLIETALGMANVEAIAQASRRLEAMHFGVADFAASLHARTVSIGGLNPDYPGDQWHAALVRMVTACRAYGLRAIDGPYGDFKDPDGFRAAARRAAALGYEGKWAIHPSQLALANEVFTPPPAEVEGARGRAGGVKVCTTDADVRQAAKDLLGKTLVTVQTGPEGLPVHRLLVEQALPIERELYVGLVLDRKRERIVVVAHPHGGMEIEEIAQREPEAILREVVEPAVGMRPFQARELAFGLGLAPAQLTHAVAAILGAYRAFRDLDATMVEMNPLVVTKEGQVLALDVKMSFDDNAMFRRPNVAELRDYAQEDPREAEAAEHGLNYVALDGDIGCIINGAGLAMATMDMIKHAGGEPANFLDIGGGASPDRVTAAFRLVLSDRKVKAILVNVFAGINRCDWVAAGVVQAVHEVRVAVPLVVRLAGTNVDAGRRILSNSGLPILTADTLSEAAEKVVAARRSAPRTKPA